MAPLQPHWKQPSHPEIQEVHINDSGFTSKSISKISLPPFGLYARMSFPPCSLTGEPTYATVQIGRNKHLNLNSDLLYINHSCEPSLIFDTSNLNILAGPNGLRAGEELTFFYPSTEWSMAQPFDCFCGKPSCRGRISGAKDMTPEQLEGLWINGHIRELLAGQRSQGSNGSLSENDSSLAQLGARDDDDDATAQALRDALKHAERVVEATKCALQSYVGSGHIGSHGLLGHHRGRENSTSRRAEEAGHCRSLSSDTPGKVGLVSGLTRRGPTSRELSGEMGGDTAPA